MAGITGTSVFKQLLHVVGLVFLTAWWSQGSWAVNAVLGSPKKVFQETHESLQGFLGFESQMVSLPPYSIGQEQVTGQSRFNKFVQ
jgi:hypothetical protein